MGEREFEPWIFFFENTKMCQPIKLQTLDLKTYKNKNKYKNKTKPNQTSNNQT